MSNKEEVSLGFLIGSTRRLMLKKMNEALAVHNIPLTLEQFLFLSTIKTHKESLTQQDLAILNCKDKSAILRTVDVLESKGLVRREADKTDRRKNFIHLTDECIRLFDHIREVEKKTFDQLKEGISPEDYEAMERVMYQIQKNASK